MPSFVYVLGCKTSDRSLTYVGWTLDVAQRLAKHNSGAGARSTRGRVWALLHTEEFSTRQEAMSREWHLKRDRKFRKALASQLNAPLQRRKRKVSSAKTGSSIAPDQSI
jgi:putative endonuclease